MCSAQSHTASAVAWRVLQWRAPAPRAGTGEKACALVTAGCNALLLKVCVGIREVEKKKEPLEKSGGFRVKKL